MWTAAVISFPFDILHAQGADLDADALPGKAQKQRVWISALSASECPDCAGANLDVDVSWKYLNFFMEDDAKLDHIGREYGAGRMFTGDVKKELIQVGVNGRDGCAPLPSCGTPF